MAELYTILETQKTYFDRKHYPTLEEYRQALARSSTVYVGNLSIYTTQDSVAELFGLAGQVKQIIMGIDDEGHPCGFCFVIYQTHQQAQFAVQYVSKARLHQRVIRVDLDAGFKKGREKGRGTGGQQRRDDFRTKQDTQRPNKRNTYQGRDRDNKERDRGERRYDRNGDREGGNRQGGYRDRQGGNRQGGYRDRQGGNRQGGYRDREGGNRQGGYRDRSYRDRGYQQGGNRDGRNRRQNNDNDRFDKNRQQPEKRQQMEQDY